jgi:acetoin utilization deacetylase AcuC-like enzyme
MLTIYSDDHHLHHGRCELMDGQLMPCFEMPSRADHVLQRVKDRELGPVQAPEDFGLAPLQRIHSPAYLDFFKGAWQRWTAFGQDGDLLPYTWPARTLRRVIPTSLHGQLGYYSFDGGAPITAGTWQAAYSAAQVALTAQQAIQQGARSAFALCRPPGHHAASDLMGGYCYLNNAAIAAQAFLDQGHTKVAILDVDYHHGNGTQSIFYERDDVLFTSIHGHPEAEFPFFLGYADELGEGAGEGFNFNYPLPQGQPSGVVGGADLADFDLAHDGSLGIKRARVWSRTSVLAARPSRTPAMSAGLRFWLSFRLPSRRWIGRAKPTMALSMPSM